MTPGSGPGHIALFSYDPLVYEIGRGALEGTGIGFDLGPNDIAARGTMMAADLLREAPGVAVIQSGGTGNVTSLFMRGGESSYTKVLLDGYCKFEGQLTKK